MWEIYLINTHFKLYQWYFQYIIFCVFRCRLKGHNKRPHRVDVTKLPPQSEGGDTNGPTPVKAARMAGVHDPHDPNSSDHVVAVTQLKEQIAHLNKQISIKESQLLAKDRQVSKIVFWNKQIINWTMHNRRLITDYWIEGEELHVWDRIAQ